MVVRKKDLAARKPQTRTTEVGEPAVELAPAEESRLHKIKRRSGARRFFGVALIVAVLLLAGWFATQAVLGGWNLSTGSVLGLFGVTQTQLAGEAEGRVNIVLLGTPGDGPGVDGPDLTDTVIVASLGVDADGKGGNGLLFSLPRDLYVRVPGYGNSKLNAVYKIGSSSSEIENGGTQLVQDVVGESLGLTVPYYLKVDFSGFERLIDALGGVTVDVEKDIYDDQYPTPDKGYQTFELKAGTYTMDGALALKYARSRYSTSDFDRARRQHKLLLAIREKAMEMDLIASPTKALEIMDALADSFQTNLTLSEIKRALALMKDFDATQLTTKVFDDSPTGLLYATRVDNLYVLRPVGDDFTVLSDYVSEVLSGSKSVAEIDSEVNTEPLKIEVLNGTNVTGLAGKVATALEAEGYDIVTVGNNATKGLTKTIVYDLSDGARIWEVRRLASSLNAEIGTEEIVSNAGALARVVLGSEANQ